jgi:hypothetical protein
VARRWRDLNDDGFAGHRAGRAPGERAAVAQPRIGRGEASTPMGHWLGVDLDQNAANHDAIGAWIAVRAGDSIASAELTVGGGHVSGQLVPSAFRPGERTKAEVRVTWPDGEVGPWLPADADASSRSAGVRSAVEPPASGVAP